MFPNKKHKKDTDLLNGNLWKQIVLFTLPLAASSILQQLFNSVDVAVVGHYAGNQAQAAVGSNTPVINLLVNLFVGISIGANVVVANYIGQKRNDLVKKAVHTAMSVALISGIILLIAGQYISGWILRLVQTPDDVLPHAILYLRLYFTGMPFIMTYNFGAAILRSAGDTKRPLICLFLSGITNAILNIIFVVFFHMGVAGVAIATVVSNVLSAILVLYFLLHEQEPIRFHPEQLHIYKEDLLFMLRIGVPSGLQSTLFSISNVCILSELNTYGSSASAGSAIALNFEFICFFFVSAYDQAAITFTSQNYGAKQFKRCKRVFSVTMFYAVLTSILLGTTISLLRYPLAGLFNSDPVVIEFATTRIKSLMRLYPLLCSYEIGAACMRGIGYSMTPAIITIFGTCCLRLIWVFFVCPVLPGFENLLLVYPISWILTGTGVLTAYFVIRKKVLSR